MGALSELLHRALSPQPQVGPPGEIPTSRRQWGWSESCGWAAGREAGDGQRCPESVTLLTTLPSLGTRLALTQARLSSSHTPCPAPQAPPGLG